MVVTSDGGFALAGYSLSIDDDYDFWLVKTDMNGNMLWNRTFGGTEDEGSTWGVYLISTSDGGFALTGYTRSFGAGHADFWLVKTDENGNIEWNQTFGGTNQDVVSSLVEVNDGGYALAGHTWSYGLGFADFWLVRTDINGNILWNQTFGGIEGEHAHSLIETSDGGFAITGYTSSIGAGGSDFWLVKTDSFGFMEWNQTYGGASNEIANSLVESEDGGLVIAGYTTSFGAGNMDMWLVKTDENGDMEWNKTYGGIDYEQAFSVIQTSDGGYALGGQISYLGQPISNDFFFIKTDGVGNLEWGTTYGGSGQLDWEIAYSLVETSDGGFALAGEKSKSFWLVKDHVDDVIPEFSPIIAPIFLVFSICILLVKTKMKKNGLS